MGALAFWMHHITPAEFGRFEVLRSALLVVATPLGMGLSAAAGRWYVELEAGAFRRFLSTSIAAIAVVTAVLTAALFLVPTEAFREPDSRNLWLITLLCAGAIAFQAPLRSTLVLQSRAPAHSAVVMLQALTTVGLGSWLLLNFGGGVRGLLLGYLAGFALAAAAAVVFARKNLSSSGDLALLRDGMAYGLPLIPHLLAHQVMTYADRLLLDHRVGAEETGFYSTAYLFASGLTVIALSLNKATLPQVFGKMKLILETDETSVRALASSQMTRIFTTWLGLVSWLAFSASLLAPEVLTRFMPESYAPAAPMMPWVIWGTAMHALYLLPVNSLLYRKKTSLISIISIGSAVLNIALNLVLIPRYHGLGAALATLIAYSMLAGGVWVQAHRHLPAGSPVPWLRRAATIGGFAIATYAVLAISEAWSPSLRLAARCGAIAISAAPVVLAVRRTLRSDL
jgi:O-antigen/teichoic acid export membrane protein